MVVSLILTFDLYSLYIHTCTEMYVHVCTCVMLMNEGKGSRNICYN